MIKKEPNISQKDLVMKLKWTLPNVKYYSTKLQKKGVINRVGTNRKGHWKILDLFNNVDKKV